MVLLQQLINGLMLGSTYALVAIGYTLIFGVLRLLHFAHGEVYMIGGFIGLESVLWLHAGPLEALALAALGCGVVGAFLEYGVFRPIRRHGGGFLAAIVASLGVGLVMQEVMSNVFGTYQAAFPPQFGGEMFHLGSLQVSSTQLFILGTAFVLMLGLHLFVTRTRFGMAMRGTAEDSDVVSILGVNADRIVLVTLVVASALGGVAGVLVGLAFNAISPYMGVSMSIKGVAIMLIGGLGSIYGAMAGGLLLGIVEVLSVGYLASSYRDGFSFALMILVLLLRPRGLFATGAGAEP
jgi:branched-chain amino acid transport system permease protein